MKAVVVYKAGGPETYYTARIRQAEPSPSQNSTNEPAPSRAMSMGGPKRSETSGAARKPASDH